MTRLTPDRDDDRDRADAFPDLHRPSLFDAPPRVPSELVERAPAAEAVQLGVPPGDLVLAELPAEEDRLAARPRPGEVHQARVEVLHLCAELGDRTHGAGDLGRLALDVLGEISEIARREVAAVAADALERGLAPLLRGLARLLAPGAPLILQTVHPFAACGDAPYRDGWREETFANFGEGFGAAMPWYFRTVASWLRAVRSAGLVVVDLAEPTDPATGRPLSLLLTCQAGA